MAPSTARRWRDVGRVAREETSSLFSAVTLAQLAMAPLPLFVGSRLRASMLRAAGMEIGGGTVFFGAVRLTGGRDMAARVRMGRSCEINFGCTFDAAALIEIGDRVGIGQEVMILTNKHAIGPPEDRVGPLEPLPVRIGDGAWLSTRALILPGVTVGAGAVVAAGAVVTRSVPPDTLVAGVPAKPIRSLPT